MSFFPVIFSLSIFFYLTGARDPGARKTKQRTVAEGLGRGSDRVPAAVVDLGDLGALEQLLQARHDRVEAELVLGAVLGAAQVGRQQHLGAVVDEVLEGGDRGADAGVVGDLEVLVERDVEVGADLVWEREESKKKRSERV